MMGLEACWVETPLHHKTLFCATWLCGSWKEWPSPSTAICSEIYSNCICKLVLVHKDWQNDSFLLASHGKPTFVNCFERAHEAVDSREDPFYQS